MWRNGFELSQSEVRWVQVVANQWIRDADRAESEQLSGHKQQRDLSSTPAIVRFDLRCALVRAAAKSLIDPINDGVSSRRAC